MYMYREMRYIFIDTANECNKSFFFLKGGKMYLKRINFVNCEESGFGQA